MHKVKKQQQTTEVLLKEAEVREGEIEPKRKTEREIDRAGMNAVRIEL